MTNNEQVENNEEMVKEMNSILDAAEVFGKIVSVAIACYLDPKIRERVMAFANKYLKEEDDVPSSH